MIRTYRRTDERAHVVAYLGSALTASWLVFFDGNGEG